MTRQRRSLRLILVLATSLATAVTGCAQVHPSDPALPAGPPPPAATALCDDLAPAWASALPDWTTYGRSLMQVSPSGTLLAHTSATLGGGVFVRADDGAVVRGDGALGGLDPAWRHVVGVDDAGTITVRDSVTSAVVREAAAPPAPSGDGWFFGTRPIFSKDGGAVVTLDCWDHPATSEGVASVREIDLASGAATTVSIGNACYWSREAFMIAGPRRSVFLVGVGDNTVTRVSFEDNAVVASGDLFDGSLAELIGAAYIGPPDVPVIGAALSPDGGTLAVVTRDGYLRSIDAATLEADGAPMKVGLAVANGNTYMPTIESPLAFSPDAKYLAFLATDGRVSVLERETGEVLVALDGPFEGEPSLGSWSNAPMAIAFAPSAITVGFEGGLARWACPGTTTPASGSLDVAATGPSTARYGDFVTFSIDARGSDRPMVRWIEIDGEQLGGGSISPDLRLYVSVPAGVHTIQAFADDGTLRGSSASTTFVVEEAAPTL